MAHSDVPSAVLTGYARWPRKKDSPSSSGSSDVGLSSGHDPDVAVDWKPKSKKVDIGVRKNGPEIWLITKPPKQIPRIHYHPARSRVLKESINAESAIQSPTFKKWRSSSKKCRTKEARLTQKSPPEKSIPEQDIAKDITPKKQIYCCKESLSPQTMEK